jgi:threonine dehydrogenase-like Zn-dependent dehydrogenase
VEFLAIGAHAVARAGIVAGQKVLVMGAGPIGAGVVLFARLRGAEVTVMEGRLDRLSFASAALGASHALPPGDGDAARLQEITGGDYFPVVFDCTGSPQAMERGFSLVAHGGNYVLVSIVQGMIGFSDPEFHRREMTLLSSRNATLADFAAVMGALHAGHIPTNAIRTHRAPLWQAGQRFPEWLKPETGTIKAMLEV